jgi:hypothetical protein
VGTPSTTYKHTGAGKGGLHAPHRWCGCPSCRPSSAPCATTRGTRTLRAGGVEGKGGTETWRGSRGRRSSRRREGVRRRAHLTHPLGGEGEGGTETWRGSRGRRGSRSSEGVRRRAPHPPTWTQRSPPGVPPAVSTMMRHARRRRQKKTCNK